MFMRLFYLFFSAMSVQFGFFAQLTWGEYSWDIMEPVTYFTTCATLIGIYVYFTLIRQVGRCITLNMLLGCYSIFLGQLCVITQPLANCESQRKRCLQWFLLKHQHFHVCYRTFMTQVALDFKSFCSVLICSAIMGVMHPKNAYQM